MGTLDVDAIQCVWGFSLRHFLVDGIPAQLRTEDIGAHDRVIGLVVASETAELVIMADGVEGMEAGVNVAAALVLQGVLAEVADRVGN